MSQWGMTFDPESLAKLARMYGFEVYLAPEVGSALGKISDLIALRAQEKTWQVFTNPTGALASTIRAVKTSDYEAQVEVDSPYGRRREYGFSGMTDALGRYYPSDPGKPYLEPAMEESQQESMMMMDVAINIALERINTG